MAIAVENEEDSPVLAALRAAEDEERDESKVRTMAASEDVANQIVAQALARSYQDPDAVTTRRGDEWVLNLPVSGGGRDGDDDAPPSMLPFRPVYDLQSLVDKFGGVEQVYEDHSLTADEGLFGEDRLQEMKFWLFDYIQNHTLEARNCTVEFEYEGGARLIVIGTDHLSRESTDFVLEVMERERPECLVLERRLGDDSLQRLTIPEQLYLEMSMGNSPAILSTGDTCVDRVRKFHQDRMWLEGFPAWCDIGAEACQGHEFGVAFEEFARQRAESEDLSEFGPRGGTVVLGDADLRGIMGDAMSELYKPALSDFSKEGPNVPLRDLILSQCMRVSLRTHRSVVAVVGKDHLEGVTKLMKQDPRAKLVHQGIYIAPPSWQKDLDTGGRKWERAANARNSMFVRMTEAADIYPYGTFLSAQAALELYDMREQTIDRLQEEGLDAQPVAQASSLLARELFDKGEMLTPRTEDELRTWLNGGEVLDPIEPGFFPFENPRQRKIAWKDSPLLKA